MFCLPFSKGLVQMFQYFQNLDETVSGYIVAFPFGSLIFCPVCISTFSAYDNEK